MDFFKRGVCNVHIPRARKSIHILKYNDWYLLVHGCLYMSSLCEIPLKPLFIHIWILSLLARLHLCSIFTLFYTISDGTKVEEYQLICIPFSSPWGAAGAAGRWSGHGEPECFLIAALFREIRLNAMKPIWAWPVVLKMDNPAWPLIASLYKATINAMLLLLST